jgi:hypothetical protein
VVAHNMGWIAAFAPKIPFFEVNPEGPTLQNRTCFTPPVAAVYFPPAGRNCAHRTLLGSPIALPSSLPSVHAPVTEEYNATV